jgi:SRSO17 transposase
LAKLSDYLATFRQLFARADQARCFELYVRGLLDGDHRKNVESIATQVASPDDAGANLAQSLQHFVSQSPWDAREVIAKYRAIVAPWRTDDRVWIVHDGVIPKKGRSSVGVHRQFARSIGKKVNCQTAVVITDASRECVPVAIQLYLPTAWTRENTEKAARTLPAEAQVPRTRAEIAIALLDELKDQPLPEILIVEEGYASVPAFQDEIVRRGLRLELPGALTDRNLQSARACFDWLRDSLGLGHFEGRTWIGWHHHVALVLAAFGFLVQERQLERE